MEDSWAEERFRQIEWRFDRLETSIEAIGGELRAEIRRLRKQIEDSGAQLGEGSQDSAAGQIRR